MLREILLFSFLLDVAFASDLAKHFVENILQTTLQQELKSARLLPAQLPDFTVRRGGAEVNFTFGSFTGLDKIRTIGECPGPWDIGGERSLNCTLTFSSPLQSAHKTFIISNSTDTSVGRVEATVDQTYIFLEIVGRPPKYFGLLRGFLIGGMGGYVSTPRFTNVPAYLKDDIPFLQNEYVDRVFGNLGIILREKYNEAFRRAIQFQPIPQIPF